MKQPRGFSFTEVIVAIAVIAVGLIPVFAVFSRGAAGTEQTKDEVQAYHYASELLAFARSQKYEDLAEGKTAKKEIEISTKNGNSFLSQMDAGFDRSLEIKEYQPGGGSDWPYSYKLLMVEVAWKTAGVSRKIQIPAIFPKGKQ